MTDQQSISEPFILFEIAGSVYGLRSRDVRHIEMAEEITPVPNASPFVEGVIFSRGQVIPALNLRLRFGFEKISYDLRTRLVVIQAEGRIVGLLVDSAREFISIPADAIRPPHETIIGLSGKYLEGIATLGERIVLILDLGEILSFSEALVTAPTSA